MALEKTIEIDGNAISSAMQSLTSDLKDFEQKLIELDAGILTGRDELKGSAYDSLFESIRELIDEQKKLLFFEQVVHDEIKQFVEEIGSEEESAVGNFNV